MSNLQCPHCYGEVPRGATVCRGCHAEVEYGAPRWSYAVLILLAIVAGAAASSLATAGWKAPAGWGSAIAVFAAGALQLQRCFARRVVFIRYRSR